MAFSGPARHLPRRHPAAHHQWPGRRPRPQHRARPDRRPRAPPAHRAGAAAGAARGRPTDRHRPADDPDPGPAAADRGREALRQAVSERANKPPLLSATPSQEKTGILRSSSHLEAPKFVGRATEPKMQWSQNCACLERERIKSDIDLEIFALNLFSYHTKPLDGLNKYEGAI